MGKTPLANALLTEEQLDQPEPRWPLELAWCPDCSLVQITETVPPETLFREYAYFSSFSDTMVQHARGIAERLTDAEELSAESLVVEIASNDGYLLQWYKQSGIPVLGIEPARNIARVAEAEKGIPTISEFFGRDLSVQLAERGQQADVIHANNVLAHVPDLNGVVAGFATLLKPTGIVVVETPYLKDLIDHVEFDTIYHEHLCYFSLTALDRLFRRHGLEIIDVERLPIHGGSLRIFARHHHACDFGLKGHNKSAQGNALGVERPKQKSPERAKQADEIVPPFQGFDLPGPVDPGRCPGLVCFGPSGQSTNVVGGFNPNSNEHNQRGAVANRHVQVPFSPSDNVRELLAEEATWACRSESYRDFGQRVEQLRRDLTDLIGSLKSNNQRIAVYGASAKGSTLLNYFGIGADLLDYVVDRSTVKQGRYTPGTRLKIHDPDKLSSDQPDYCLLLTWNFADEILAQQKKYRDQGGKFIIPIPNVRVA